MRAERLSALPHLPLDRVRHSLELQHALDVAPYEGLRRFQPESFLKVFDRGVIIIRLRQGDPQVYMSFDITGLQGQGLPVVRYRRGVVLQCLSLHTLCRQLPAFFEKSKAQGMADRLV